MPSLHDEVVAALDSRPPADGVIVCKDGRILAARDPAPGGSAILVMLGVEPYRFPEPPRRSRRKGNWIVMERTDREAVSDGEAEG